MAIAAAGPFRRDLRAATAMRGPAPVRLSRNESAYGPSPDALAAIRNLDSGTLSLYPDVEYEALRQKLAALHGVTADRIVLGSGSADLLHTLASTFLGPTRGLVAAHPTCDIISSCAERACAPIVRVPLAANWSHDVAAMRGRCSDATGLVYVCNPNNPTGSLTPRADIEALLAGLPPRTHLVVDEAYHDYVNAGAEHASFLDRPVDDRRIIVVRSFSKAYGLAGLRIGYLVASAEVVARVTRMAGPATVTSAAAVAAAAAVGDRTHLAAVTAQNAEDRQEFYNQANARMLRVIDSHANFVMLNTIRRAADIVDHFARNGIAVPRPFDPLADYVRVTLGAAADMQAFWRVWDLMSLSHTL
jgi:histidinol-phosphate aminotransferase